MGINFWRQEWPHFNLLFDDVKKNIRGKGALLPLFGLAGMAKYAQQNKKKAETKSLGNEKESYKLIYSFIGGDLTKKKLYEQIESKLTPIR